MDLRGRVCDFFCPVRKGKERVYENFRNKIWNYEFIRSIFVTKLFVAHPGRCCETQNVLR